MFKRSLSISENGLWLGLKELIDQVSIGQNPDQVVWGLDPKVEDLGSGVSIGRCLKEQRSSPSETPGTGKGMMKIFKKARRTV
ncbi:hypothetical protein GUJ93_ZPchr0009g2462 [Zizania palustris]|uniref:Uncharacterized protein n=1 Tax=Zizania palustris TaxID=103762 RepID=A0A8J5RM40_ZIZPA|nr:hypothetical protein GUJ93_ZPchr0009g2462 [Zizania palustris]